MVRDLGARGRSAAYHPDGSQIAVGLAGGGLVSSETREFGRTKKVANGLVSSSGRARALRAGQRVVDVRPVSYTHLTLPTKA